MFFHKWLESSHINVLISVSEIYIKYNIYVLPIQDKADFQYIDVWSSKFTWGGLDPPTAGDFIIVPTGQTLLVDVNTPILKMVLIMGQSLACWYSQVLYRYVYVVYVIFYAA